MTAPRWRIQKLATTTSTNDDARRAAEAGEAEGLVITADTQTGGRGRHGRQWQSPDGNLYGSILLRPPHIPEQAWLYGFVACLAVCDVVQVRLPEKNVTLKWPNDVLVGGKKISGILLEVTGDALLIGIGINIQHYPESSLYPATSLQAEGAVKTSTQDLLSELLSHLGHWYEVAKREGFAPLRSAWLKSAQQGSMSVKLLNETVSGTFDGIGANGSLHLGLDGGQKRVILSGDVLFV